MVKRKRNKGLTLVEILIAISVFSVLVGVGGLAVSTIKRANFKKAAETVQRAVATSRTACMAKGSAKGAILFNTRPNGSVVVKDTDAGEKLVCNGSITVSYIAGYNLPNSGATPVNANILEFNTDGTVKTFDGADTGAKYYLRSNDGSLQAEVIIYPITGKTALRYL